MYSESDTRAKYIDPSLKNSSWQENQIIREFYFTDGRINPGGSRGKRKFCDYILTKNSLKLAIIEAKKDSLNVTEGLEQAKNYAEDLKIPIVFSSNGKEIYEFDLRSGKGEIIKFFPNPEELYEKVFGKINKTKEILLKTEYSLGDKKPRYYQENAINETLKAIGDGKNRILLTLATGTGKTVIAFQLCYKLFMARWSKEEIGIRRPRILFLADRNILVDQAMNTFNPLEKDLIKINGEEIRKRNGKVPKNANIFFSIYQALTGGKSEENGEELTEKYFERYEKDFFDLIIIDECHRGGAKEDGNWAEILKYFDSAVHIGLTATPKRDDNVDTYKYFGDPIYEYSLKNGIDDGFLTPFKIKRLKTNLDEFVLNSSDKIISGEVTKEFFTTSDMERNIVIAERSDLFAQNILQEINKNDKTIVFCVDQDHALRMRDSINKYKTSSDKNYCVRVTSDEGEIGRTFLEQFQDNDKTIPVILTSSQMLTTGVDARNVRNIVLAKSIGSIVEYKQIVGRGTRLFEGKSYFTIIDFVGSVDKFSDEVWDGAPENIEEGNLEKNFTKKEKLEEDFSDLEEKEISEKREKLVIELGFGREVKIIDREIRYLDPETGKHLSREDYLQKLSLNIFPQLFSSEEEFQKIWANPETRGKFLEKLKEFGIEQNSLEELTKLFSDESLDIYDVIIHLSFQTDLKFRKERYENVLTEIEKEENLVVKDFLQFLMQIYLESGIYSFGRQFLSDKVKTYGKVDLRSLAKEFGGNDKLLKAYLELQEKIYEV